MENFPNRFTIQIIQVRNFFFKEKVVGKVSSVIFTKKKPVNLWKIEKSKDKVFLEFPRKKEEVFFLCENSFQLIEF